jgi:hypothetical protein
VSSREKKRRRKRKKGRKRKRTNLHLDRQQEKITHVHRENLEGWQSGSSSTSACLASVRP